MCSQSEMFRHSQLSIFKAGSVHICYSANARFYLVQWANESGKFMVVTDRFQERLLDRIDREIAAAEELLNASRGGSSATGQQRTAEAINQVQELLIRMREHRRRVRRSFHFGQQSVTHSLVGGLSTARNSEQPALK